MPIEPLSAILPGTPVLIDANIFIYAASAQSAECEQFLQRCTTEDVLGVTTLDIVSEVCHRRMVAEAFEEGLIARQSAPALRRKPDVVRRLHRYQTYIDQIFSLGLLVLELTETRFRHSALVRSRHGLLTTDSLILAAAELYGIEALATRDDDFDEVPWLTVYKPRDIP